MWVVFILVVLWLGYLKSTSTPFGKALLRRSQGWEAYAHLAKNGIELLFYGVLLTVVSAVALYFLVTVVHIPSLVLDFDTSFYNPINHFLTFNVFRGVKVFELSIIFFSYIYYLGKVRSGKDESNWKVYFKNQDAILNVILEAAESQTPLRISLKSRKVYIGIIESEQFERADLDNIVIIPYLSGHRDKDTLEMVIDHNYSSVYEKNNILDDNFEDLSRFRVVIRLNEVESLSLFDAAYYADFYADELEESDEFESTRL